MMGCNRQRGTLFCPSPTVMVMVMVIMHHKTQDRGLSDLFAHVLKFCHVLFSGRRLVVENLQYGWPR